MGCGSSSCTFSRRRSANGVGNVEIDVPKHSPDVHTHSAQDRENETEILPSTSGGQQPKSAAEAAEQQQKAPPQQQPQQSEQHQPEHEQQQQQQQQLHTEPHPSFTWRKDSITVRSALKSTSSLQGAVSSSFLGLSSPSGRSLTEHVNFKEASLGAPSSERTRKAKLSVSFSNRIEPEPISVKRQASIQQDTDRYPSKTSQHFQSAHAPDSNLELHSSVNFNLNGHQASEAEQGEASTSYTDSPVLDQVFPNDDGHRAHSYNGTIRIGQSIRTPLASARSLSWSKSVSGRHQGSRTGSGFELSLALIATQRHNSSKMIMMQDH